MMLMGGGGIFIVAILSYILHFNSISLQLTSAHKPISEFNFEITITVIDD